MLGKSVMVSGWGNQGQTRNGKSSPADPELQKPRREKKKKKKGWKTIIGGGGGEK